MEMRVNLYMLFAVMQRENEKGSRKLEKECSA